MRVLVLHNADAGFGSDAIHMFVRSLAHKGDECVLRILPTGWVAADAVADADDFDLVVVSGGDGTVSSLLWALREKEPNVCVFPSGTANLFFNALGNVPEPAALARACRIGATAPADIGRISWKDPEGDVQTGSFALMSGTGYDATLMRAAVPNKKAMGEAAYFFAAVTTPSAPTIRFSIDLDGATVEREGLACIVANTAMIQGDIEIVPDCRCDDGLLDVIVLEAPEPVGLLRPMVAALVDRHGSSLGRPTIERFRGRAITVSASQPVPMQIDGDPLPYEVESFSAEVVPAANNVVVDALSPYAPTDGGAKPLFPGTEVQAFPRE